MIIVSVDLLNNCVIIPYFSLKVISPHAPTFRKLSDLANSIHVANKIVKMYFVCALFTAV